MWVAERLLLEIESVTRPLVVVLGGGPVGLLSALERKHSHNDRVLVIEKRKAPSRSQVVALREGMSIFLFQLMAEAKAKATSSPKAYESANILYNKKVRYEQKNGHMLTFQLVVLEQLLRILAEILKVTIEEGTVVAVCRGKELIYTKNKPDGSVDVMNKSYDFAIDASGGHLQNVPSGSFEHPNLHQRHGTFELKTSEPVWIQLQAAPNMLEVALGEVKAEYPHTWGLDRAPITRVFPFVDLAGDHKVYIGTELPFLTDGVDFVKWVLQHRGINVDDRRVIQTSTFFINDLKYYSPGFDQETDTFRVGDALYQPHYLTASGINNAYGELTDIQFKNSTDSLNDLLMRRRQEYYQHVAKMLKDPKEAGRLFFQG